MLAQVFEEIHDALDDLSLNISREYKWDIEELSYLHPILKSEAAIHDYINKHIQPKRCNHLLFECECRETKLTEENIREICKSKMDRIEEKAILLILQQQLPFVYDQEHKSIIDKNNSNTYTLEEYIELAKENIPIEWTKQYIYYSKTIEALEEYEPNLDIYIFKKLEKIFNPLSSPNKNPYFYKIVNMTSEELKDWIYMYMKPREVYPGQIYYDVEEVV